MGNISLRRTVLRYNTSYDIDIVETLSMTLTRIFRYRHYTYAVFPGFSNSNVNKDAQPV